MMSAANATSDRLFMNATSWLKLLEQERAIAVIRSADFAIGLEMAKAVYAGGMNLIEITWNSDRPAQLIKTVREILPDATIGVGTITTPAELEAALEVGVEFIFAPGTDRDCIQMAVAHQIPIVPGALTPTEIVQAWNAGATCVKVFPVHALGGATYIKSLKDPLGQIPLIPTGGITLANAPSMLEAGAIAVGLAGDLFPKAAIASGQWPIITAQAQQLVAKLQPYRL
jgi:2-dehydro-3-deoxyphosphogluconate aldolase / (4S)-4-hydroxy-2-oxoglutarate aldolase